MRHMWARFASAAPPPPPQQQQQQQRMHRSKVCLGDTACAILAGRSPHPGTNYPTTTTTTNTNTSAHTDDCSRINTERTTLEHRHLCQPQQEGIEHSRSRHLCKRQQEDIEHRRSQHLCQRQQANGNVRYIHQTPNAAQNHVIVSVVRFGCGPNQSCYHHHHNANHVSSASKNHAAWRRWAR
jgi:hypothetical protein